MDSGTIIALAVAIASFFVTVVASYSTHRHAKQAHLHATQASRAESVMHFTDRFFELLKQGDPKKKLLEDSDWTYLFWSLQATEFYFFHHGILPASMYALWMMDLAELYRGDTGVKIWNLHKDYLRTYSQNYSVMTQFFEELFRRARLEDEDVIRNKSIDEWIRTWIKSNRKVILD